MSTVSLQLKWQALQYSKGSCHSKEYTENISLTSLTLLRLGVSHTEQEKNYVCCDALARK